MDEYLKGGKWSYPIDDGRVAVNPFNGQAFIFTRSQQNLKRTDGRRWVRSYAANYVAYEEERASLNLSFRRPDADEATVETDGMKNIKISGVRKFLDARSKKLKGIQCNLICRTDMLWGLHQLPYVLCNAEFVELPTVPQDCRYRYTAKKMRLLRRLQSSLNSEELAELKEELKFADNDNVEVVKAVWFATRLEAEFEGDDTAPVHNRMTPAQKDVIMEHVLSPGSKDKIQSFGVRHPWLLCLCNPLLYYQFVRVGKVCDSVKPYVDRVFDSPLSTGFVDGFHCQAKLVFRERQRLFLFVGCRLQPDHPFLHYLHSIFCGQMEPSPTLWDLTTAFVVVVPSFVPPKDPVKWLCHMTLVGGDFETEKEVLCSSKSGLRSLLERAKLIQGHTFADVYNLLERFVSTELMFFGCSRSTFEIFLQAAERILISVIIRDEVPSLNIATTPGEILDAVALRTEQLSRSILEPLIADLRLQVPDFPAAGILDQQNSMHREPVSFEPVITSVYYADGRLMERLLRDQKQILQEVQDAIRHTVESKRQNVDGVTRLQSTFNGTKIFNVLGPPGCGKTVVQRFCAAFALSQGLNVLLLTGSTIRAASIGGQHLHKIFPMPVEKAKRATPHSLASSAVNTLNRPLSAHIRNFLLNVDMVIFEEAFAMPAENVLAVKTILEFVKDTHESFGGILVFMSGDNMQATLESRYSILDAPFILYTAANYLMHEMARSRNDSNLTDLLQRLRGDTSNANVCAQIAVDLWRGCSFTPTFSDLPPGTPILFGKTAAVNKLTEELRPRHGKTWDFPSSDECYREFTWKIAAKSAIPQLNRLLQTPEHLFVYTGALIEVTQNLDVTKGLLHGRFATITAISQDEIRLFMHRPGENLNQLLQPDNVPQPTVDDVTVTRIWSFDVRLGNGTVVRRRQFPIRLAQCGTVHRYQGCEIQRLAMTFPFDDSTEEKMYALWQKNLLISLISRTTSLKNVYIVLRGRSADALEAQFIRYVATLTGKKTQFDDYVQQLMLNRDRLNPTGIWQDEIHPYKYCLTAPAPHTPVCYVIVSRVAADVYVGQTVDFEQRLLDHQHGRGSYITRAATDWEAVAFAFGFSTSQRKLLHFFEEILQQRTGLFSTANRRRPGLLPPIIELNCVVAEAKRLLRLTVEDFNGGSLITAGLKKTNGEAFQLWWCMDL
ncbi:MAG: hypothetical protein KVP17_000060 [Porospora cf. gigantea B]|nr:MAG: hypothetical protein KVP17_000060 [Porospora cf. gigantea B]